MCKRTMVLSLLIAALMIVPFSPARAQGSRLHVIASFSILADVVANVAGDAADVSALIPVGANPHTYEPSAQDVAALSDADMVIVAGLNFEESLLPIVREATGGRFFELWGCIPLRPVVAGLEEHADDDSGGSAPDQPDSLSALCTAHHNAVKTAFKLDTTGAPGTMGTFHENPSCGAGSRPFAGCDPHVWTDPVNAGLWALMARDMLSAADPANAAAYAANADAYLAQLADLDAQIRVQIEQVPDGRRYLITNHLTFNYFAGRYGLTLVGVVIPGGSTTTEPTAQGVIALIQTIQEYGVPAIFTETTVSDDIASQIADEAGAQIVPLYTGSLSEAGGPADTYLTYITYNAAQIAGALQ